jgi:hypothetical protein
MEDKKAFKIPTLPTHLVGKGDQVQMTTREEQEKYKIYGVQDGKVDELIAHEKKKERKLL